MTRYLNRQLAAATHMRYLAGQRAMIAPSSLVRVVVCVDRVERCLQLAARPPERSPHDHESAASVASVPISVVVRSASTAS